MFHCIALTLSNQGLKFLNLFILRFDIILQCEKLFRHSNTTVRNMIALTEFNADAGINHILATTDCTSD